MRKILFFIGLLFFAINTLCFAKDVYVNGYTRSDGTYVAPYHRSSPNSTVKDNYSYEGNTNPYTGKVGDNHYRNNPTSDYYGTSSSTQSSTYNYGNNNSNRNSSYNSNDGLISNSNSYKSNTNSYNSANSYGQQNSNQYNSNKNVKWSLNDSGE